MNKAVKTLYRPYRPSNGTEGMIFEEQFCDRCVKNDPEKGCEIQLNAFCYQIDDPQYPKEWIEDGNLENPRCTAFEARK